MTCCYFWRISVFIETVESHQKERLLLKVSPIILIFLIWNFFNLEFSQANAHLGISLNMLWSYSSVVYFQISSNIFIINFCQIDSLINKSDSFENCCLLVIDNKFFFKYLLMIASKYENRFYWFVYHQFKSGIMFQKWISSIRMKCLDKRIMASFQLFNLFVMKTHWWAEAKSKRKSYWKSKDAKKKEKPNSKS